jgi:hypothetical protein
MQDLHIVNGDESAIALHEVPSLSRLLDVHLEVDVDYDTPLTSMDDMKSITVSIPTGDYMMLSGADVEKMYLRPMVEALAKEINILGTVTTRELPEPEGICAVTCTNGKIPVTLTIVRRENPDRHQLTLFALVQPVEV